MKVQSPREIALLFLGDLLAFYFSLTLAIYLRGRHWPSLDQFVSLAVPFTILFLAWIIVFFSSDLYGKQTAMARRRLPSVVGSAQLINTALAIIFFYFIPYFGVAPKTILFICLVFSFVLVVLWRRYLFPRLYRGRKENVLFLCQGPEVSELMDEFRSNRKYNIKVLNPGDAVARRQATLVVINDLDAKREDEAIYYRMIFSGVRFASVAGLYEEVFDRVPVNMISERWFLENVSNRPKPYYDLLKRIFDLAVALGLGSLSLVFYPLVWLMIKLDDGGPVFFSQERVGKNGAVFKIYKFRSMKDDRITRVGEFLRRSRLDELPQLWSVIMGDQSLVGPRPEKPDYAETYRQRIKFYDIRHIISPGLSGWAQIYQENHPHFSLAVGETLEKLSYDLYYIKNRNFWLDLKIALKTLNILVRRKGR
jgi:lipopolysaccharide/colanic/teichoic acid biosynthesis glycosyltransferase